MFTGIVEDIGTLKSVERKKDICLLKVESPKFGRKVKLGESIAVNGVCLTVSARRQSVMDFDVVDETLRKTTLGVVRLNQKVNLERALTPTDRISGHFVTGHIDGTTKIIKIIESGDNKEVRFALPQDLQSYIVPKGSVCIDGVSLTIGEVGEHSFSVHIVPYTKQETTLGAKQVNDRVNVEADVLAKYLVKAMQGPRSRTLPKKRK